MFIPDKGVKRYLTCNENRQQRHCYVSLSSAQHPLGREAIPLRQFQKNNASVADIRESMKDRIAELLMENMAVIQTETPHSQ